MSNAEIQDVSDTALWVATYRTRETESPEPLFKDPLAKVLAGARGEAIAKNMQGSKYTAWSVIMRTYVIDKFLMDLVAAGFDTVLNLGAGLDTRPYRLDLPVGLSWIEVDYPHMIQLKEEKLKGRTPRCNLQRVSVDLADVPARRRLFEDVSAKAQKVVVLTEGVLPYLTNDQVAALAQDLRAQGKFRHWIVDYFSPEVLKFIKRMGKRKTQLKNAPFQFEPENWQAFFAKNGWQIKDRQYLAHVSLSLGRLPPSPWWVRFIYWAVPKEKKAEQLKNLAYVLLEPI